MLVLFQDRHLFKLFYITEPYQNGRTIQLLWIHPCNRRHKNGFNAIYQVSKICSWCCILVPLDGYFWSSVYGKTSTFPITKCSHRIQLLLGYFFSLDDVGGQYFLNFFFKQESILSLSLIQHNLLFYFIYFIFNLLLIFYFLQFFIISFLFAHSWILISISFVKTLIRLIHHQ